MVHCFVGATGNWSGQCRAPATESVVTRARQRISISCRDPQALQTRTSPRPLIYRAVWIALSFQACSWSTPQATSRLRSLTKNENQTMRITQSVVKGTTSGPAAESLGRGMIGYYFRGIPCVRRRIREGGRVPAGSVGPDPRERKIESHAGTDEPPRRLP